MTDFKYQAKERGINVQTQFLGVIGQRISSDKRRILQVLKNLLSNALKFTPPGGDVLFSATRVPLEGGLERYRFVVKDTGIGIGELEQKALFAAYSQANPGISARYGGTGLGLSLSLQLARALGGDLRLVESCPGKGSVFEFELVFPALRAASLCQN